jgi:hypothetical protein
MPMPETLWYQNKGTKTKSGDGMLQYWTEIRDAGCIGLHVDVIAQLCLEDPTAYLTLTGLSFPLAGVCKSGKNYIKSNPTVDIFKSLHVAFIEQQH